MQQEIKSISLSNSQSIQQLVIFAKGISEGCQKFTKQFINLVKDEEQTNSGKIAIQYYDLLNKYFKYTKTITPRPLCGKLLNNGVSAFKCFQCQNQNNSIICIQCFNKSDHKGHNYQRIPVVGGCCDCGDDEKWKIQGSCSDHNKKDFDIEIDKEQTQKFIKQMKYVIYLVFVLNFSNFLKFYKLHQIGLLEGFVTFMMDFNEQSMISNQMTFLLFKSEYTNKYPEVMIDKKKYYLKMNFISVLTRFYKEKQFSRKLVDLFIIMFTRIQFKKYLTRQYNKLISQKAEAIISEYSNISCQIYTSHKIIQQLLKQNKFPPIQLAEFPQHIKFDVIADSYARFYIDLTYLAQLYNNIGQKYIAHHFSNSNIVELTGYENYVRGDFQFCIQYYGIEFIFFHNRANQFLKPLLKNKMIFIKAIKDIVDYLNSLSEHQKLNYYISKQRTLCLLLFMYFDGDIGKAVQKSFLDDLGFSYELIFRILQATLNVIRFYAVLLANRQTVERYYTFYAFSLLRKSRTLVSLDFQLVKFCLLSLQLYSPTQIDLEYNEQKNTSYILTIPFSQNLMSVQNLISLPVKFLRKINKTVNDTDDGAYDRKKALGFLSDYIGLMNELIITNHAELNLKKLYLENNEKEIIQLYGNLMKSLKSIKPELFKQVSKIIFGDDEPYFVKFIKQYCVIQNKTLKLNPMKEDKFELMNLSYLKSIKNCQIINQQIQENNQKHGLQLYPKLLNQTHQINELRYLIFNATFINDIVNATQEYLLIFKQNHKILNKDIAVFEKFVEELIKLNYNLKSNKLEQLIKDIQQIPHVFQLISQKNRNQIMKCLGKAKTVNENEKEGSVNNKSQQEKKRMEQLKKKKLQKLKSKQIKALNSHTESQKSGQMDKKMEQMSQYTLQCMYCKHTAQNQPLFILCFTQKSNLFTKNYLNMNRCVDLITSCNHLVHYSCSKNINKQKKYFYCNFCKTSSNLLVEVKQQNSEEIKGKLIKSKSMQIEKDSSEKLTILKRIKKFKSSMQEHENSFEQDKQVDKSQVSQIQKKIEVIAHAILYGVIVDYNFFVKSLSNACGSMLRELASQTSIIKIQNLINQLEQSRVGTEFNQDEKIYWESYKFAILLVSSLLVVERDHKGWDIRQLQQKLPKKMVQNIITLLTSLKTISCLKILEQTKLQPLSPPILRQLPQKLSELSKQMGQCPNCSRITNEIALCMLCEFKSCVSCEVNNLTNHAESHGEASIFIRVDEGLIIYVSLLKNRFYIPIYRDFMGNYFILQKNKQDRSDYNLDTNECQKIRTDIIRHRIQQHIRYEQLLTNKYSTINP